MSFPEEILFETKHWKVILRREQRYLGRCVIPLKRSCGDLAELTEEEMVDFLSVVRAYETLVRLEFAATMFNWSCLMNDAFQEENPTPQVHWHVRPRYKNANEIDGSVFEDPNFGHHYLRGPENDRMIPVDTYNKLLDRLRSALNP